jgi:mannose-1-phosphate guanylyltransferase
MVIVIFCGGSGTRLWPLSQGDHPKHLLRLTGDQSGLQASYHRADLVTSDVYLVTEVSHAHHVRAQLPKLDDHHIIIEPGRRGTASCIILALSRIRARHPADEVVAFMHSDHEIPDAHAFAEAVQAAVAATTANQAIALVGITPTHPATGLGYIECGQPLAPQQGQPVYKVNGFKEKPTLKVAEKFLAAGNYLWNQGLFAASISLWEAEFKAHAPYYYEAYLKLKAAPDLAQLSKIYLGLETEAIDYALWEHTNNLVAIPAGYDWVDIGSFFDIHKLLKGDDGNTLKGRNVKMVNCEDSMVHANEKPVIAIGLSGIIVVDTPEGLLVCAKEQAQLVGKLSKELQAQAETATT